MFNNKNILIFSFYMLQWYVTRFRIHELENRVTKPVAQMTSHFELLTRKFLYKLFF